MTKLAFGRVWRLIGMRLATIWSALTSERGMLILTIAILTFGGLLRLNRYLFNRSLFIDEANIAANVLGRSFAELTQPLEHFQVAPIGWLVLVKAVTIGFGKSEPALRLVPLLSGLGALALIYPLSRRFLSSAGCLVSALLIATTDPAIRWSVILKPYSTDLLIAMAILLIGARTNWSRLSRSATAALAAFGALAIWFSFTAVFVLAAVGVYALLSSGSLRRPRQSLGLAVIGFIWLFSFAGLFAVSLRPILQSGYLYDFWSPNFASLPAPNPQGVDALLESLNEIFRDPVGIPIQGGGPALFLVGVAALLSRVPQEAILLLAPTLLTYIVSVAGIYPFSDRLVLFLVPGFHLSIAAGIELISKRVARLGWLPLAALLCVLIYVPARLGVARGVRPRAKEEMRPVTAYVLRQLQEGDAIYIYYGAATPWLYYVDYLGASETHYDLGSMSRGKPDAYLEEISRYEGRPRVWFVFSHVYGELGGSEEAFILTRLRCIGTEVDSIKATGARAYLYDLTGTVTDCGP